MTGLLLLVDARYFSTCPSGKKCCQNRTACFGHLRHCWWAGRHTISANFTLICLPLLPRVVCPGICIPRTPRNPYHDRPHDRFSVKPHVRLAVDHQRLDFVTANPTPVRLRRACCLGFRWHMKHLGERLKTVTNHDRRVVSGR